MNSEVGTDQRDLIRQKKKKKSNFEAEHAKGPAQ
jgi:hypothetical protein